MARESKESIIHQVPNRSFSGNQAIITIQLIKNDAQPMLILVCIAMPCESTVQGVEPRFESTINPSPIPRIDKAKIKTDNVLMSNDQRDVAAQDVWGITRTFFFIKYPFNSCHNKRNCRKNETI